MTAESTPACWIFKDVRVVRRHIPAYTILRRFSPEFKAKKPAVTNPEVSLLTFFFVNAWPL